jgi:hypothetical protein
VAEANIEVIPDNGELAVAVNADKCTVVIRGRTNEIVDLAQSILAAGTRWVPEGWPDFAQEILAHRPAKMWLPPPDHLPTEMRITSDADLKEAEKVLDALKKCRSFLRAIFSQALQSLEKEMRDWSQGKGPQTVQ